MVHRPDLMRRFEDSERLRLAGVPIEVSFHRLEQARLEARSLRPDLWVFPTKTKTLLEDSHVRLLRRMRGFFKGL
jgi:hypothetical protein